MIALSLLFFSEGAHVHTYPFMCMCKLVVNHLQVKLLTSNSLYLLYFLRRRILHYITTYSYQIQEM